MSHAVLKGGRRAASGWIGGAVAASLLIGSLIGSAPVASAESEDLLAPLPRATVAPSLVAATGDYLVNFESGNESDVVSVSTDRGATWADVDPPLHHAEYVADGKIRYSVAEDAATTIDLHTYDLATGTESDPVTFPSGLLEVVGRDYAVYGTNGTEDTAATEFAAAPVSDPSGAAALSVPAHTRDSLRFVAGTGAKGVAVSTDRDAGNRALTGYLDVVSLTGGDAGYQPAVIPGLVGAAMSGEDVYYVLGTSTNARVCRRSVATPDAWATGESCLTLKSGDFRTARPGTFTAGAGWAELDLWYGNDAYVGGYVADWSAATPKLITLKASGAVKKVYASGAYGDLARPLVVAYTTYSPTAMVGYLATVGATGALTRFGAWPTLPIQPSTLSLSASRMAGIDGRSDGTAWERDLARPGAEHVLATHARDVLLSGGRTAVNSKGGLVLLDHGTQEAKQTAWAALGEFSGRTLLGSKTVKSTKPTVLLGSATISFAADDYPIAVFGTTVATVNDSEAAVVVYDVALGVAHRVGSVSLMDFASLDSVWLWGDTVGITGYVDDTSDATMTEVVNYRKNASVWSRAFDNGGYLVGLSDGAAVMWLQDEQDWRVVDFGTGALSALKGASPDITPSLDAAGRVLYATDARLVVHQLGFGGASTPRALSTVAPVWFNSLSGETQAWTVSVDATKAVTEGTLELTGGGAASGTSISLPVAAAPDGAIRISWDGRLADGTTPAPAGDYTWKLAGFDGLTAINGVGEVGGRLTVAHGAVPYPQVTPVIDHPKPATGTVLTADPGPHPSDASSTIGYQWYCNGKVIRDATAASYTATAGDVGKKLSVKVSFTNSQLYLVPSSKTSASTAKVAKGTLVKGTVTLADPAPLVDTPVKAVLDGWGPAPVTATYKWYRVSSKNKAKAISKQTKASYTPTWADLGYRLKVVVTGAKSGYTSASVTSALSAAVISMEYLDVSRPAAGGIARVDMTLTATPGTYVGADGIEVTPAFSYQWYRVHGATRTAIKGATGATYRAGAADRGLALQVAVTAKLAGYPTATSYSVPTDAVKAAMVAGAITISPAPPVVGAELSASSTAWTPADAHLDYQWFAGTEPIAGANKATYTPVPDDLAKKLRVRVTGSADGYADVMVYSAYTVAVLASK